MCISKYYNVTYNSVQIYLKLIFKTYPMSELEREQYREKLKQEILNEILQEGELNDMLSELGVLPN